MKQRPDGTWPYRGVCDAAVKTVRNEGIFGFWAGLPTYYARVGPHSCLILITSEVCRYLFWPKRRQQ